MPNPHISTQGKLPFFSLRIVKIFVSFSHGDNGPNRLKLESFAVDKSSQSSLCILYFLANKLKISFKVFQLRSCGRLWTLSALTALFLYGDFSVVTFTNGSQLIFGPCELFARKISTRSFFRRFDQKRMIVYRLKCIHLHLVKMHFVVSWYHGHKLMVCAVHYQCSC